MKKEYLTANPTQTKKLGENFAKKVLKTVLKKKAVIIGLQGDLGSGKTTFLQGFAKGLGIKEKILSPTFVLMKKFEIINPKSETNQKSKIQNTKFKNFYHIDCYRIKKPKELLDLGLKEIISNPQNIIAIEWSERVKKMLPGNILKIKLNNLGKEKRSLTINFNNDIIKL